MKTQNLNIIFLAALLAGNIEYSLAKEIQYKEKDSGTFSINTIDVNQDGFVSATAIYSGDTSLGRVTGQGVSEFSATDNTECPEGTSQFELVPDSTNGVRRFQNGDLLFTKQTEARFCIDFFTGEFTALSYADYVGGTGKFAKASGNNILKIKGQTMLNQGFSAFTSEITGNLILPDKPKHKHRYKPTRKNKYRRYFGKTKTSLKHY